MPSYPYKFWRRLLLTAASTIAFHSFLFSQCPITVNAGPDMQACAPSGTVTLQGSISGNYLGFNWNPTTGMNNPTSLTPTVTVTSTQTYTLTAAAVNPNAPNLVTNPGFESLNTGFTSDYSFTSTPITPGTYVITTSPALVLSTFPPCDDHTFGNGTGQMMLVNGAANGGDNPWCQTIAITPNTWYSMSAWVTASPISPPELQFALNGVPVGSPYTPNGQPCEWQQFSAGWYSGSLSSVQLCITDQNGSGNGFFGDDYALDDIYFGAACTVSDAVTVSLIDVMAVVPPVTTLLCSDLPAGLMLSGAGSSTGPNISYQWTTPDGNILSGANTLTPVINLEGTYTLTVTYSNGPVNCTDQATIQVLPDPNIVFAFIAPADELNCNNPTVTLNGGGSSTGPTISYSWSPTVLAGGDTQFPTVGSGGTYTLTVTNSISGCTATASVIVFENFIAPTANADVPGPITCDDDTQTLDGTGSSTGNEFSYQWTTTDGNIVSGATTLNDCIVDESGAYTLIVTNSQNGCTAADIVLVMGSADAPTVIIATPDTLTCALPTVQLDGTGSSSGTGISYLWTTSDGNFAEGDTTLMPTVDAPGTYVLTVSNSTNGCSAADTVLVLENSSAYTVSIALPDTLTCASPTVQLDATASSQGPDLTYTWTTTGGNFTAGDTTLTPTVDAPGTYLLTIADSLGCSASDSVLVLENTAAPTADAGPAATIGCDADPVQLDGTGSSTGPDFSPNWTTTGGNFAAGENTLTPDVDAPGAYFLTITDATNGCAAIDSTTVMQTGDAPTVSIAQPDTLDCLVDMLTLDASGSSQGPDLTFTWTFSPPTGGPGGGFPGDTTLTPTVDAPGTYTLTLTDTLSGCLSSGSVTVVQDTLAPIVSIAPAGLLTCLVATDTLDASASSQGGNFSPSWTSPNGQILSGATTYTPVIGAAGAYIFVLENLQNHCTATDTITVNEDVAPPVAVAGAAQTLTCTEPDLSLDGTGSSTGANFTYLWTTTDGNFAAGENTLTPTVDAAGNYLLTVTDTLNGCTATDSVAIGLSADLPQAQIQPADTLTCAVSEIGLSVNASTGPDFTYLWTTQDGNFAAGETTLTPTVDAPGTYLLTVTDTTNGCTATDAVTVQQDGNLPTAEAGQPFTLSCSMPAAMLDGSGSTPGLSYLWTTGNGNILSGETTLTPNINAAGTYLLTVADPTNGCSATDQVVVSQDANAPTADAGLPDTMTCLVTSLQLDGTGSSQGPNLSYSWTTMNGSFSAGQSTLTPTVDAPGTYLLTVTDLSNSCQGVASVQVFENVTPPEVQVVSPVQLTCLEDTLILQAVAVSGPASFLWVSLQGGIVSGENTPNPVVNLPDTYVADVTDASNGCSTAVSITVEDNTMPPAANVAAPNGLTCLQPTVQLNGSASSSGPGFSFAWTTTGGNFAAGQTTLTPTVDAAGSYLLTVTNNANGCTASASVTVTADTATPVAMAAAPQQLGCDQQQVTLDGSGSTLLMDYLWTTPDGNILSGNTTLTPVVDAAGSYTLTVTNPQNGCTATATATVLENGDVPDAMIAPPSGLTCLLTTVTLDASASSSGSGFALNWSTSGGNFAADQNTLMPTVDAPGTYTLTIENTANGCTATASVTVTQTVSYPGATAIEEVLLTCDEPEVALLGSSPTIGATFDWTTADGNILFGAATTQPGVDAPGTYLLTVTNPANGCTSVDSTVVVPTFLQNFTFENTDPDCLTPTGSITFSGVQGGVGWLEYSIDGGQGFASQNVFDGLPPGLYDLAVQDSGGCLLTSMVEIIEPFAIEILLENTLTLTLGEVVELEPQLNIPPSAVATVEWTPATGLSCADCLEPELLAGAEGSYTLLVTDVNGCTASASVLLSIEVPNGVAYVPNAFSPNGDGINDAFVIFGKPGVVRQVRSLRIFTRWGESVWENFNFPTDDFDHGWDGTHRGKLLDAGVFVWFAELELANGEVRLLEGEVMILN